MVSFEEIRGVDLHSWFPSVVAFGISFPFDKVLQSSRPSMTLVAYDMLHFVFFFTINQIWRWAVTIRNYTL
jgi:hypothetical protein